MIIAIGKSAKSRTWKNTETTWPDFVARMRRTVRTAETVKEYARSSKADRSAIKDVGGYVGGYLLDGKRHPENVISRRLVTLDADSGAGGLLEAAFIALGFDIRMLMHSTHSHTDAAPRYRLIIPLDRDVTAAEYPAIARWIAGQIGIERFDPTTFETNRLMYWPSCSADAAPVFLEQAGDFMEADWVLSQYVNWQDSSLWPTSRAADEQVRRHVAEQADPLTKPGVIGAFCRSYTVQDAIAAFLSDRYTEAEGGRYTYTDGSTEGGLVLYADKFAYSHHGTDPASGQLCNAFDLVRLHRFGHTDRAGSVRQSLTAMEAFALEQDEVRRTLTAEKRAAALEAFGAPIAETRQTKKDKPKPEAPAGLTGVETASENPDWMLDLALDGKGNVKPTSGNVNLIIANDPVLKGAFGYNEFDSRRYLLKAMPWRHIANPCPVEDVDYAGLRDYISCVYDLTANGRVEDSLTLSFERHRYHPVRDYLDDLIWDGEKRLDTFLTEFFGVDESLYAAEAFRKMLVGGVARIYEPGCKFDLVLMLYGAEGTYKSSMISKLGKGWSSDTFSTVSGKEAYEQLQGVWLVEIAELNGMKKQEVEAVKHFISKQVDRYRPAYGREIKDYRRQCVMFGTTNHMEFLSDPTGNRRFMPVWVKQRRATKSVAEDLTEAYVDQLWAEAVTLYQEGERLYLSKAADVIAEKSRSLHSVTDERAPLIEAYLETPLPDEDKWEAMDIYDRRTYLRGEAAHWGRKERDSVCVAEIWAECLGLPLEEMTRWKTSDINGIMKQMKGWHATGKTRRTQLYGSQRHYTRLTYED